MTLLDAFFGNLRLWRRLRGGIWLDVFHVPSTFTGWLRLTTDGIPRNYTVFAVENYELPRARAR